MPAMALVAPVAPAKQAPAHLTAPAARRVEEKSFEIFDWLWHRRAIEAASMPAASVFAGHRAWREVRIGALAFLLVMDDAQRRWRCAGAFASPRRLRRRAV